MKVSIRAVTLHPRNVFRISRAARREVENVLVQIERDGVAGWGEAPANACYGEESGDIAARLERLNGFIPGFRVQSPEDIAMIWDEAWPILMPSRAAQCALDVALWDWLARRRGTTVAELALGREGGPVLSFATIGICEPGEIGERLAELAGFPRVKVKAGAGADLWAAAAVRAAMPEAMIAVDANGAWAGADTNKLGAALAGSWIEFVEQPLPPGRNGEVLEMARKLPVPMMADEACVVEEDVERVGEAYAGFNIKLSKCGGLTPALRMARRGKRLGLRTMVGCMLESSVLIAAGAVVAQLTDYADLDGAWLLGDDPGRGWGFDRGVLSPRGGDGLGVEVIIK